MKSKYFVLSLFLSLVTYLTSPGAVSAQTCNGSGSYGGECPPVEIFVNKQVQKPSQSGVFVENLTETDPYSPTGEVLFKLLITNSSNQTWSSVKVIDVLPAELEFVSGPGTYDAISRTLTFTLENMNPGETREVQILARVKDASYFKQNLICNITNFVKATAPGGQTDEDTASLCVQTQVLGVTTLPAAGFNDILILLPFAAIGLSGISLLKKKRTV